MLRRVVVELDGMVDPEEIPVDSTHGTVKVVRIWIVVTGTEVAVGAAVVESAVVAQVTIAGFWVMCGAQIPWK